MNDNGAVRVLLSTRGSSGHITPLAPFGHACVRAGHEVLVAAQPLHRANVERNGLPFAPTGNPAPEEWMPLLSELSDAGVVEAHEHMIGDFFARIDVRAALPPLRALVESWRPDVIVRESWEFASALVSELCGVPLARVGLGTYAVEEDSIRLAAAPVEEARAALGLPPDPGGERLRASPYLTVVPELLEEPGAGAAHRFRQPEPNAGGAMGDWWPDHDAPLVYVTLGSVTAAAHLPYFPAVYREIMHAVARVPARLLLTVGEDRPLAELGPLPANVHVERWVPQGAVLPRAAAVVCHGGHGSTLGALAAGVPAVVLPLFSIDQAANAAAVARAGAGLVVDAGFSERRALDLPADETVAQLTGAVTRVLEDDGFRRGAQAVAAAMAALPPVDAAVELLAELAA
jgi:UDP:flavonoid glycosyltransferase YjiC (YdhE family)